MKLCDDNHDEVVFTSSRCPVCEAREEIVRHERYQEELIKSNRELMGIVVMTVDSQSWDGNDPNDDRWTDLYTKAKYALRNGY